MTYNIVVFYDTNYDKGEVLISAAQQVFEALGKKYGAEFSLSRHPIPSCTADSTCTLQDDAVRAAKCAHAILFVGDTHRNPQAESVINRLAISLGLYAKASFMKPFGSTSTDDEKQTDYAIVSDTASGIAEGGFRHNSTFGREAFDELRYSELEIERVARIAYELSETRRRKVTLVDMSDKLNISKLWRKIVADINEDYPYVSVNMMTAKSVAASLLLAPAQLDIILTSDIVGDILCGIAGAPASKIMPVAYLGETTLGLYDINGGCLIGLMQSIAMLLRHSLDMSAAAENLESATPKAPPCANASGKKPSPTDIVNGIISKLN